MYIYRESRVNFFGRIVLEIRGNIFFILRSVGSAVTSSRGGDKALLLKNVPTTHLPITGFGSEKFNHNMEARIFKQTIWLFSINIEMCLIFHRICNTVSALQHIPIYVEITKYPWPVAGSVCRPQNGTCSNFGQITGNLTLCSTTSSGYHQKHYQSSESLALCEGNLEVTSISPSQRVSNVE